MDFNEIQKEFERIKTCLETGRAALARKQYRESKDLFEEALALCDRGHPREHPDRLDSLLQLSDALIAMKDFTAAASTLTELRKSTPADQRNQNSDILLLLKLSYCLEKSGRLQEACSCYEELISLIEIAHSPSNQTLALILERYKAVLSRMGVRGKKLKELESRARNIRKEAHSSEARTGKLLETVEHFYGEGGKPGESELRTRTLRAFDDSRPSQTAKAIVNRLPAAIGIIVVIVLMVTLTRPVLEGQFQSKAEQFAIAKSDCLKGDYLKAGEIFDHLLAQEGSLKYSATRDANLAVCYWYDGGCKVKLADYEGAVKSYTALLELKPDFEPALVGRGGAYLFKSDFEKALQDCNRAVLLDPKDFRAYDFRGTALLHFGRNSEADADMKKAMNAPEPKRDAYIWEALPDPVFTVAAGKGAEKNVTEGKKDSTSGNSAP
jgi:tetratricopeptide (TPR) repeat protein